MSRVVASIEARMRSSRLPGKVLADINGQPALTRLVHRLRRSATVDDIVLATSVEKSDDILAEWANSECVPFFRGSEQDVLSRVVGAQRYMRSDIVVEVTGDCILIDPEIIDLGVNTFMENDCDVVTNTAKASHPMGIDVQVFSLEILEEVEKTVHDPAVREHVSLYFYENPEKYRIYHLLAPRRWKAPDYRFQLDYPEDLKFIRKVYKRLEMRFGDDFGIEEIFNLLRENTSLMEINMHCEEKSVR